MIMGGRRSHEIAQRMRQSFLAACGCASVNTVAIVWQITYMITVRPQLLRMGG